MKLTQRITAGKATNSLKGALNDQAFAGTIFRRLNVEGMEGVMDLKPAQRTVDTVRTMIPTDGRIIIKATLEGFTPKRDWNETTIAQTLNGIYQQAGRQFLGQGVAFDVITEIVPDNGEVPTIVITENVETN